MEKIEKNNEKRRKESLYNDETNNIIKNGNNDIKKTAKRENNNEDVPSRKPKNKVEERDTTGDTKVFQVIRKEDIEREKRKQAIKQENIVNKQNIST